MSLTTFFLIGIILLGPALFAWVAYQTRKDERELAELQEKVREAFARLRVEEAKRRRETELKQKQKTNGFAYLNLSESASEEEVTKAFRRLSFKYHPDQGGDPIKFANLVKAKEVCLESIKRKNLLKND